MYKKSKDKYQKETSLLAQQRTLLIRDKNNSKIKKENSKNICRT